MDRRKTTAWIVAPFVLSLIVRLGAGWRLGVDETAEGSDEASYDAIIASPSRSDGHSATGQHSADGVHRPTARYMPVPLSLTALGVRRSGGGSPTCRADHGAFFSQRGREHITLTGNDVWR